MMGSTDSFSLAKFERSVIMKNKTLFKELRALQNTVSNW